MTDNSNVTTPAAQSPNASTLIEFPGVNRNRPAWRKELSERFREIQQRRARESEADGEQYVRRHASAETFSAAAETPARAAESATKQLGLVPPADEPEPNPIVAAALARLARARASAQPVARHGSGRAQTAAARVVEEQPEEVAEAFAPAPQPPPLVVVQPKQPPKVEPQVSEPQTAAARVEVEEPQAHAPRPATRAAASEESAAAVETTKKTVETVKTPEAARAKVEASRPASQAVAQTSAAVEESQADSRRPRHIDGVLDEFWLERQGIELLPKVEQAELTYDDRAPRVKRVASAAVDLCAVALLCAPFAAAIELTIGNWGDQRVWGSMALIAALLMFLYHTCSVALAGRTLGMKLFGLQAVDARKACVPTTGQCMRRAFVYMLSLATLGLGILYSLFDAEGRTAHDLLSGTVVVSK